MMTSQEIIAEQILINQQLLRAIILLLSPSREAGIKIIEECQQSVEALWEDKEAKNEIQTN